MNSIATTPWTICGSLHAGDVGRRRTGTSAYSRVAADRAAAEHDDPVDQLLAGVEAVGRRVLVPDDAAAALEPFDVDARSGMLSRDPHQEDQHHAEGEREAQIVVRVLRPLRPGGERLRADQRQQQRPAESDVEAGDARG